MLDWFLSQKEWLFSGIGVVFLGFILNKIVGFSHKKEKPITVNNTVSMNNSDKNPSTPKKELTIHELKEKTHILFIDDQDFPIVKNLQRGGWNATLIHDISDIDAPCILRNQILFVDINGVAKDLSEEEGIGLVKALKNKYKKSKKVIIYSSDSEGDRFNNAFRVADDFLPKQSEYYDFVEIIEKYAKELFNE